MRINFTINPELKGTVLGEIGIDSKQHLIIKLDVPTMVEGVLVGVVVVKPNCVTQEH